MTTLNTVKASVKTSVIAASVNHAKSLGTIKARIEILTATVINSSIEIGQLLTEAKGKFQTGALFLQWAEEQLGYKKSYVFSMMKVANEFGSKEWAHSMTMGALDALLGSSPAVMAVAEAAVKAGEPLTAKEVKEVKAEEAGEELPQVEAKKELTPAQLTKALEKANNKIEATEQKAKIALDKAKSAKDDAIKASRKALSELEQAKMMIAAQKEEIARLVAEVEALHVDLALAKASALEGDVNPLDEVLLSDILEQVADDLSADDLPWSDDDETEEVDASKQLALFEDCYTTMLAQSPRKVVANTDAAAMAAGIAKDGKLYLFNGESLTGAQLRALIA